MNNLVKDFNEYRENINDLILSKNNLGDEKVVELKY